MNTMSLKRLPSADWLAFEVALAVVFLEYLVPSLMSIIALVVFLPLILRELGMLRDIDEAHPRGVLLDGVFRILVVAGVVNLAPALILLRRESAMSWSDGGWVSLLVCAVGCAVMIGVAYLVRRRPRAGGAVLLLILVVGVVLVTGTATRVPDIQWQFASSWLQQGIVFGLTGVALFREIPAGGPA